MILLQHPLFRQLFAKRWCHAQTVARREKPLMHSKFSYFFISFGLLALLLVPVADAQVCTPAAPGLVSWWSGDGNALDSRSRQNGNFIGTPAYASGRVGQSLDFDTTRNVEVPDSDSLDLNENFSIELWVLPKQNGNANFTSLLLGKGDFNFIGTQSWGIILTPTNGVAGRIGSATQIYGVETADPIPLNEFSHIVFTKAGTELRIYVNGVLSGSGTIPADTVLNTSRPLIIGGGFFTSFGVVRTPSLIDELSISDRTLSAGEVTAIYNADMAGKCKPTATVAPSGLLGWWFGDGNANDSSPNSFNATLQNGASYAVGKIGQAFNFSARNQYVDIPNDPALFPQTGFSLETWIRPESYIGCNPISNVMRIAHSVPTINRGWLTQITCDGNPLGPGFLRAGIFDQNGTLNILGSSQALPSGEFTHFAFTWDGSTLRLYVNGILQASQATTNLGMGINTENVRLGNATDFGFLGQIDEPSVFNRALSADEVQSIFNAGAGGKLKNTVTSPRSGQVGFWRGDGNPLDSSGFGNNGILTGTSFVTGQIGNALRVASATDKLSASGSGSLDIKGDQVTIEGWIRLENNAAHPAQDFSGVIGKNGFPNDQPYLLFFESGDLAGGGDLPPNQWQFSYALANSSGQRVGNQNSNVIVTAGTFNHVAMTYNGSQPSSSNVKLYVNGALQATNIIPIQQITGSLKSSPNEPFVFQTGASPFEADEIAIYNRELSAAEIAEIYNQGLGFKAETPASRKTVSPLGGPLPVRTAVGDVTLTFDEVITGGTTQQVPLSGVGLPALPSNPASTLFYDIATSAEFSGNVGLCFNLPSFTTAEVFATLFVIHLENGQWTNRTTTRDFATRTVCAQTTSLSPFAIIPFAPPSANASISGQVATLGGRGISNVSVTITGGNLDAPRRSLTNAFGYYRLDDLAVGNTYILQVGSSKRFTFKNGIRIIDLNEDLTGADFFADAP